MEIDYDAEPINSPFREFDSKNEKPEQDDGLGSLIFALGIVGITTFISYYIKNKKDIISAFNRWKKKED